LREPELADVIRYFDRKTDSILARYGPGPRVHYHTGLVDRPPPRRADAARLRKDLIDGQELMLREAADCWDATRRLSGDVLDVGCGLGGGSLFWAQEYGACVTALTCVPAHAELVARFARQAGVADRVRPLVCDACHAPGRQMYDAIVAVDSSGYLPRRAWFERAEELLRPGGCVFIIDCFLQRPSYAEFFNEHWRTRIGALDEYCEAARSSGLGLNAVVDVTERTVNFWTTTLALINLEALEATADQGRMSTSRRAHASVRDGLANGGFRYSMLAFEKTVRKIRTRRSRPRPSNAEAGAAPAAVSSRATAP
jgi:tocopherol O-methyltransferase